tara:strand:- start:121 stop:417 length:297 start_codon:yes stop_codon:yes gene_type:complete
MDHLYIVQSDVSGAIKIGRSKDPRKRLKQLQTGSPYKLKLLAIVPEKGNIEKSLHSSFSSYKKSCKGEWFDFDCVGSFPDWLHEMIDWDVANVWWEKK